MTRETKIGLLVGLGFIVVFAVLLSNHDPAPPTEKSLVNLAQKTATDTLPLGRGTVEPENTFARGRAEGTVNNVSGMFPSGASAENEGIASSLVIDDIIRLPSVDSLDSPSPGTDLVALESKTGGQDSAVVSTLAEAQGRKAPPNPLFERTIPDPIPTERENQPRKSPALTPDSAGSAESASLKEYVVQRGDTLWKIAKDEYKSSKTAVVEHIVQANAKIIKDKDSLVVGQKIVLPQLPSDLFEPVESVNVSGSGERLVRVDQLLQGTSATNDRRAPEDFKPVTKEGDKSKTGTVSTSVDSSAKPAHQEYIVQPRDTFTNIAEKQLGSKKYWTEIKKLNPGVDPTRMTPGMKIKLPNKRSLTQNGESQRASA